MAFIDMGDQFLARERGPRGSRPTTAATSAWWSTTLRRCAKRRAREGIDEIPSRGTSFNFRDPWGNRFQVVDYREVQFERTAGVQRKLGVEGVEKTAEAQAEIEERGLG